MDFSLTTSLKGTVFTKIAVTLWEPHIVDVVAKYTSVPSSYDMRYNAMLSVTSRVRRKARSLSLPNYLEIALLRYTDAVGLEVFLWLRFNVAQNIRTVLHSPHKILWTQHATVDRKKSAELLLRDANLTIRHRYKIACVYCLEEHVLTYFDQLEESGPQDSASKHCLVSIWSQYLEEKLTWLQSPKEKEESFNMFYVAGFYEAVGDGNEVATRFFFPYLAGADYSSMVEEMIVALRCTVYSRDYFADILCFLLNALNSEQQIMMLKSFPEAFLRQFLDWPWQEEFPKLFQYAKEYISNDSLLFIVNEILLKVNSVYKDFDYLQLLVKLYELSSADQRECVHDWCDDLPSVLSLLLQREDWRSFRLILNDAPVEDKVSLVSHDEMNQAYKTVFIDRNGLLESFVTECLQSKEEINAFRDCMKVLCSSHNCDEKFETFSKFINDVLTKSEKRCSPGSESEAKRLCSGSMEN